MTGVAVALIPYFQVNTVTGDVMENKPGNTSKLKGKPRYNVISIRVSESEHEYLKRITTRTNKSISDIMREAMKVFATHNNE